MNGKNCGKSFYPQNDFIAKYKRKSKRLVYYIVDQLKNKIAASTIAKNINIDAGFISRMLPYLSVTNTTLPHVLCSELVKQNLESLVPELVECTKTYQHWAYKIKNSLEVPYSNGPIKGTNNKIKALKCVTFGMTNFENFRARIMLLN